MDKLNKIKAELVNHLDTKIFALSWWSTHSASDTGYPHEKEKQSSCGTPTIKTHRCMCVCVCVSVCVCVCVCLARARGRDALQEMRSSWPFFSPRLLCVWVMKSFLTSNYQMTKATLSLSHTSSPRSLFLSVPPPQTLCLTPPWPKARRSGVGTMLIYSVKSPGRGH